MALQKAFEMLTPSGDFCAGPDISQLTRTCKAAVRAKNMAIVELRPALMAALHREWFGDPGRKFPDDSSDEEDSSDDEMGVL